MTTKLKDDLSRIIEKIENDIASIEKYAIHEDIFFHGKIRSIRTACRSAKMALAEIGRGKHE